MRKLSFGAFAVALMLAGGAHAQSSVQAMGLLDVYAGSIKAPGAAARTNAINSGGMTTSWFGFKGSEDLGGGLKASFALTSFMQVDSGVWGRFGDSFFSRDANVSLSGGFGSVTAGRVLAPNFLPTVIFNPFGDSFTFSPLVLHANVPSKLGYTTTPADTGWANAVIYSTPNMGGLTANVHYQLGEVPGKSGTSNVGFNVLYFNGPFAATAFMEKAQVSNPFPAVFATADTKTDWMVGASYDAKVAKVFATTGKASSNKLVPTAKTNSLGISMPAGPGTVMAAYAKTSVSGGADRSTWSLGYGYNLSKRTDLYTAYLYDKITGIGKGDTLAVGIRTRF